MYVKTSGRRFVNASFALKWPIMKSRAKLIDWSSLTTTDVLSAFATDDSLNTNSNLEIQSAVQQVSMKHILFKRHCSCPKMHDDPRILNAWKRVQIAFG